MTSVISLQRVFRVSPAGRATCPPWIQNATPIERAFLALQASADMEHFGLLSPLESLIGAVTASAPRQQQLFDKIQAYHPQLNAVYLKTAVSETWSLAKDPYWKTLPTDAQILMARYAALTKNVQRPKYSGEFSPDAVANVFNNASVDIQKDPILQRILACNNIKVFRSFIRSGRYIDPQARAIGFLNDQPMTRDAYDKMDDSTFAAFVAYDNNQGYSQGQARDRLQYILTVNRTLQRFPWNKMHIILAHHPALFIQSVVTNVDVANAHHHVARWLSPMLIACAKRSITDQTYESELLAIILSKFGRKRFDNTVKRYAPDAYAALDISKSLYGKDALNSDTPALRAWIQTLAEPSNNPNLELPTLDNTIFNEHDIDAY